MTRPTPETDYEESIDNGDTKPLLDFARKLERERDEAREEAAMWKANHDNQVKLKAALMDRHDLGDRARKVVALAKERDEARELARELRDALSGLRSYYIETTGLPPCAANAALTKAEELLP